MMEDEVRTALLKALYVAWKTDHEKWAVTEAVAKSAGIEDEKVVNRNLDVMAEFGWVDIMDHFHSGLKLLPKGVIEAERRGAA